MTMNTINAIERRVRTITAEELEAINNKICKMTEEDFEETMTLENTMFDYRSTKAEEKEARAKIDKLLKKYKLTYIDYAVWGDM